MSLDTQIRQAERAGDTLRVMRLRHRAGLCPPCGKAPRGEGYAGDSDHCCCSSCYQNKDGDNGYYGGPCKGCPVWDGDLVTRHA